MTSCSHFSHNPHIVVTTSSHRLWQSSYHEIKKSARVGSSSIKLKKCKAFIVLQQIKVELIFGVGVAMGSLKQPRPYAFWIKEVAL